VVAGFLIVLHNARLGWSDSNV